MCILFFSNNFTICVYLLLMGLLSLCTSFYSLCALLAFYFFSAFLEIVHSSSNDHMFYHYDSCKQLPYQVEANCSSAFPYFGVFLWLPSFITKIVFLSTNHPGTTPFSVHSFKAAVKTLCMAVNNLNQNPCILSGPAPFQWSIDFNFLVTSSFVIFTAFCSLDLLIHSASCLCLTLVLDIPFHSFVASLKTMFIKTNVYCMQLVQKRPHYMQSFSGVILKKDVLVIVTFRL